MVISSSKNITLTRIEGDGVTSDLTVRRYRPADADEVWAVHEAALRASPLTFVEDAPADEDLRDVSGTYRSAGGEFLVGLVGGTVVATGGFRPVDGDAAELRRMRVHPDHQRRGYGETLLLALEDRAAEDGFDELVLTTSEDLAAARSRYRKHGYERTGRETHEATGDAFVTYRTDC